jgi:isochorismate synthase EntC
MFICEITCTFREECTAHSAKSETNVSKISIHSINHLRSDQKAWWSLWVALTVQRIEQASSSWKKSFTCSIVAEVTTNCALIAKVLLARFGCKSLQIAIQWAESLKALSYENNVSFFFLFSYTSALSFSRKLEFSEIRQVANEKCPGMDRKISARCISNSRDAT